MKRPKSRKLTDNEWSALEKIATATKMDCWFHLVEIDVIDYVEDLENGGKLIGVDTAFRDFADGIVDPLSEYNLTDGETEAIEKLMKDLEVNG